MSISLPKPIAEYFAAEKAGDAAWLASCFVSDGVVHDEGGTFTGTVAIERWNAAARAKYHHTVAPISSTVSRDVIAKTAPLPFARLHADETAATPIASAPPI